MPNKKNSKVSPTGSDEPPPPRSSILEIRTRKVRITSRQLQVVMLMAEGKSMKQVAAQLKVKHNTVRKRVEKARKQVQARTTFQLMAMVGASGLYHEDGKSNSQE